MAADLPRIVELLGQLYEPPGQEDFAAARARYEAAFSEILEDPRQTLFVAEADSGIVASAVLIIVPNLTHRATPYAIVENVVVDERVRGRRIGEALMGRIVEEARAAGCYKVALMSRLRREDAHRFYERIGFTFAHKGFRIDLA